MVDEGRQRMLVLDAGLVSLTDQVIKSRSKKLRTCSEVQLSYTKCFWANPGCVVRIQMQLITALLESVDLINEVS